MGVDRARWNARHAAQAGRPAPARFLVDRAAWLPSAGRALDAAGGRGGSAVWLAERGLETTLVDVSDEACHAARQAAAAAGVALDVQRRDLAAEGLPEGPWDVVVFHRYLDRDAWGAAAASLGPGGVQLIAQPTVRNLERHPRPSRRWLLAEGELGALVAGWSSLVEAIELNEGWTAEGHHEARAVLRALATG